MRTPARRSGFTLIEILIVISIIAVLASMILAGVTIARKNTSIALTKSFIESLSGQLDAYVRDTGRYPGTAQDGYKDGDNGFPALFEALFDERPPKGKGGPNAPYMKLKEEDVLVYDEDTDGYRAAERDEIYDSRVKKYIRDPWGMPYVYHENRSRARKGYMHDARTADIYSTGPNRKDETTEGEREGGDDIGNW